MVVFLNKNIGVIEGFVTTGATRSSSLTATLAGAGMAPSPPPEYEEGEDLDFSNQAEVRQGGNYSDTRNIRQNFSNRSERSLGHTS